MFSIYSNALLLLLCGAASALEDHAKDNGDIFIVDYDTFDGDIDDILMMTTTEAPRPDDYVDIEGITRECNASFITPMSYLALFNATGSLPDEIDQTGLCYLNCFFTKLSIWKNNKLNTDLVRRFIWPATGDSIEFCEQEKNHEENICLRGYAVFKCLMLRALTDARNNPIV